MDVAPGTVVDKYTVEGLLGKGGMATVFRVVHAQLGVRFALKLLDMPSKAVRERLVTEGRLQASLRHPNIVSVVDVVIYEGCPGLVMEYVDGPALDQLLKAQRLTLGQVDSLAVGILQGVRAAHKHGMVHRDLKPGNILLAQSDGTLVPKVADFGLAKTLNEQPTVDAQTRTGQVLGTPAYMAPEQFRNSKDVDRRADVYALGVMLYEMVTGRRPFTAEDIFDLFDQVQRGDFVRPEELVPDLPPAKVKAILGAMAVRREDRIPDVETLLAVWRGQDEPDPARSLDPEGPWDPATLQRAAAFGSESDSAPFKLTPIGASRAETFAASTPAWGIGSQLVPPPDLTAAARPPPSQTVEDAPSRAERAALWSLGPLALLALGAIGAGVLGLLGVAGWLAMYGLTPEPTPQVAVTPTVQQPAPALAPLPAPLPPPAPPPQPLAPTAPIAAPAPAAPAPEAPAPAPVAQAPANLGAVRFTGEASAAWLVSGSKRYGAGPVPEGVYGVKADFTGKGLQDVPISVSIRRGQETVVNCRAGFFTCTVQ